MTANPDTVARAVDGFRTAFGRTPDLVSFAPGRVNLIGEHTDYNDGFVLPCALSYGTVVALCARPDQRIEARALDFGGVPASFALDEAIEPLGEGQWENHLRGIAAGMPRFGLPVCGADIAIAGDVPQGAGLSSSASLGVALALGLATLAGAANPTGEALARVAQWSEHHYVGCACGMMDQLASAFGQQGKLLLIDCRSFDVQPVAFPDDTTIMIVHSGVTRGLVDSAYNERRSQCELAAAHYRVPALRDVDASLLEAGRGNLDETAYRRARHVVSEDQRTLQAAAAFASGDLISVGRAMRASHISLRDDFEVSLPAVDLLVDCLTNAIGQAGGARMTGGGFGGCVVAILPRSKVKNVEDALNAHWARMGLTQQLMIFAQPEAGAHLIQL